MKNWVKVAGLRNKPEALREKGYAQSIEPRKKFKIKHIVSKYGEIYNLYRKEVNNKKSKRRK
jgi:hypothetical protein